MLAHDTWYYSAEKPEGHLFWAGEVPGPGWYASPADIPKAGAEPAAAADPEPEPEAPAKPEAVAAEQVDVSGVRDGETVNLSAGAAEAPVEPPATPPATPKKKATAKPAKKKAPAKKAAKT